MGAAIHTRDISPPSQSPFLFPFFFLFFLFFFFLVSLIVLPGHTLYFLSFSLIRLSPDFLFSIPKLAP